MTFSVAQGTVDHLSPEDLRELTACMMVLSVFFPKSVDDLLLILNISLRDTVPRPWHIFHDEDLLAIHRGDDDKPVLLFTPRLKRNA